VKVTLISPYPDITAFGLRVIAGVLRQRGHEACLVFLPIAEDACVAADAPYDDAVLEQLVELCRDSGLVGIGLMTNYFDHAVQITRCLQAGLDVPVVWGGIHPTVRPQECLAHARYVCRGEGEEAMLELVEALEAGGDGRSVPNIWARLDGVVHENPLRPLERNLDRFPRPYYGLDGQRVLDDGVIQPMTEGRLHRFLAGGSTSSLYGRTGYQTLAGRGCPHRCTYCGNDALKTLYGAGGGVRWRSAAHILAELESVRAAMPYVEFISFTDDALLSMGRETLRVFFAAYKKRIGLPFCCLTSPLTATLEKLDILVDAGLFSLQMGVQTGSARIQKLYNREAMTNERMLEVMGYINRYKAVLAPPLYDFILDAPFETAEDKRQTLRLIARIPKPFRLQPFSLVLYPGTELHALAEAGGQLHDEVGNIYRKSYTRRTPGYFALLVLLAKNGRFPSWLMVLFSSRLVAGLLGHQLFQPVYEAVFRLKRRRGRR
jgi:radical SAM superfamily enzyme YgiQ (UPF0313 family)